jgi:hypothetical protein
MTLIAAATRQIVTLPSDPAPDTNPFLRVALFVRDFNGSTRAVEACVALDECPDYNN